MGSSEKRGQHADVWTEHTALAGVAQHELNCQPVDNAEHRALEIRRAEKSARSTTEIGVGLLERGHDITGRTGFETFIVSGYTILLTRIILLM
jgi:hypothetical protein